MARPKLKSLEVAFVPGDRVTINSLENGSGLVSAVSAGLRGTEYEVRYWHNGDRKSAWFLAEELS